MTPLIDDTKLFETIESLLYRPELYTKEKIEDHTNTIAIAFFQRTDKHPVQREEFCTWIWKEIKNHKIITPKKIISHRFMQSMLSQRLMNEKIYSRMLSDVIPKRRNIAMSEIPHHCFGKKQEKAVNKWYAGFIKSYMQDAAIKKESSFNKRINRVWDQYNKYHSIQDPEIQKESQPINDKYFDIVILLKNAVFTGELNASSLKNLYTRISEINVKSSIMETIYLSSDSEINKKVITSYLELFQIHKKIYNDLNRLSQFKDTVMDNLLVLMFDLQREEKEMKCEEKEIM